MRALVKFGLLILSLLVMSNAIAQEIRNPWKMKQQQYELYQNTSVDEIGAMPGTHPQYGPLSLPSVSYVVEKYDNGPQPTQAQFRFQAAPSHYLKDDPIVYPRQPGVSHLHMFFGNTHADAYSEVGTGSEHDILVKGASSVQGGKGANPTAYWMPALVDGPLTACSDKRKIILPTSITVYYKTDRPEDIKMIPHGLEAIGGNTNLSPEEGGMVHGMVVKNRNGGNYRRSAHWGFYDEEKGQILAPQASIPQSNPKGYKKLRAVIAFPQCFSSETDGGFVLRSPNNLDHQLILENDDGANMDKLPCPASHPNRIPRVELLVDFPWPEDGDVSGWRLSSDMGANTADAVAHPGESLHGDILFAWNEKVQQAWKDECLDPNDPRNCSLGQTGTQWNLDRIENTATIDNQSYTGDPYLPDPYDCKDSKVEYTIGASVGSNGSISPQGSVKVEEGQDQSFTISAKAGYQIKDVTVDGSSVGTNATYTFKEVKKNHTISASFEAVPPATVPVSSVSVTGTSTITTDGGNTQLSATIEPSNASDKSVKWTIQGKAYGATLSSTGKLTASGEDGGNGTITVRATAQDGSDEFGEVVVTTSNQASDPVADTTPPSKPVLTASSTTQTTTELAWNAASDNVAVTSYQLFQDGTKIADLPASQTTYTASGLVASTTYAFVLEAHDAATNSNSSEALSVTTPTSKPDTEAPTTSTLTADAPSSFSVALSWTAATDNVGVSAYEVYQDDSLIKTLSGTATSFMVVDLAPSNTYIFTLKAQDNAGNASDPSNSLTVTTAPPPSDDQAPTTSVLSLDSQTQSSVTLSWSAATDDYELAFYHLRQNGQLLVTLPATSTNHTVEDLASGNYTYTVNAVDAAGNKSPDSNPVTLTIAPTEPTDGTDTQPPAAFELLASATPVSVTLSWNTPQDNYGVVQYILYLNKEVVDTLNAIATTYTVDNLETDISYTFTLIAYDVAGNATEASYAVTLQEVINPKQPAKPEPDEPTLPRIEQTTIPPLFTPNDDGVNDTWQITLSSDEQLVELKVYNQRGQLIFATTQGNQSWDGTFRGKPLTKGAYYYSLTTTNNNGQARSTTGSIAIIR